MIKDIRRFVFLGFILLSNVLLLPAQEQISEDELVVDQLFLDASREKLIGNVEKAINAFKLILEKYPDNAAVHYELSRLYQQNQQLSEAINSAELAIKNSPENKWYNTFLAELLSLDDKNIEAADLYDDLIEKEPQNEQLYIKKAFFLVKAQEIKKALKVYEQLEQRQGLSETIVQKKHALFVGMGAYQKAAAELIRLTEAYPKKIEYFLDLASFYEQIDDKKAALDIYKKVKILEPDHPKATLVLAGADAPNGKDLEYLEQLKPVFEDPSVSIDLKIGKIMPLLQTMLKKPDIELANSLSELTNTLERVHPDDAKAFAVAGDIHSLSGKYAMAIEKYVKAIELDDTVFAVWEQLLYALQQTGNAKDMSKYAEYAMDIFPNQAQIYYSAAIAYLELNDPGEAIYLLEQGLLMSGKNLELQQKIISAIGMSYALDNDPNEAEVAFKKAAEIGSSLPMTETRYAWFLLKKNQVTEAESILKKYEKQGKGQAFFEETQAALLAQKGDFSAAANLLDQYLQTGGQLMPRALELFGDLLFQSGDTERAVQIWTEAQKKGIKSTSLKKKILDKKL